MKSINNMNELIIDEKLDYNSNKNILSDFK